MKDTELSMIFWEKNKKFEWTIEHEKAFQELKNYLSSAPFLAKGEDGEPLFLYLEVPKNAASVVWVKE